MHAAATHDVHALLAPRLPAGVELRRVGPGELDEVDFLVCDNGDVLGDLADHEDLRVVQVLSAGTDWIESAIPQSVTLCNARGARDAPVAEWVASALLGAFTGLLERARDRVWRPADLTDAQGARVVILGFGSIGAAVRERLEPFGVEIVPVGRDRSDELPDLVADANALVVLAPLNEATRGIVDAALLARMRDGALVVNAGRGPVVDTDALLAETASGRLRAVLDVVDPEPLPGDHPLWSAPGVLAITPHVAGDSEAADGRAADLAIAQLERYRRGEELVNVVLAAGR